MVRLDYGSALELFKCLKSSKRAASTVHQKLFPQIQYNLSFALYIDVAYKKSKIDKLNQNFKSFKQGSRLQATCDFVLITAVHNESNDYATLNVDTLPEIESNLS